MRTAGNVSTLFLIEDAPLASMGLTGLNYSVSGGDDESTQTLTYTITELPDSSKGIVYLADGTTAVTADQTLSIEELRGLKFLAAPNAAGQATFSFSVTDSGDGDNSISETVNLDILGFNDTPILPTTAIAVTDAEEDVAYTFSTADLLAGVTDPDVVYDAEGNITSRDVDNLNVINLSVTNGELTYDAASDEYTFSPDENFNGIARFDYLITDGNGGSVSNTVNLNVVAINDTPEATFSTDQFTAEGNSTISGQLTSTDIDKKAADGSLDANGDPNPETATYSLIGDPIDGLTINADGSWEFDPTDDAYNSLAAGETQVITVNYQVADSGELTDTNSFQITLNGTNDTPEATYTTAQAVAEDDVVITGQLTSLDPDSNAIDADGNATASYKLIGAPIDGLSISADGSWEFDPTHASYQTLTDGEVLELTVNYSVTDADGASDQAAFTLTLTGTNDAPKLTGLQSSLPGGSEDNPYSITKNQLLAGFSDADAGETATLEITDLVATDDEGNQAGTFELNSTETGWTFTPNEHFNGNGQPELQGH